jgi:HD-GYP domain-containing protein (c-di-GMP phosphodiesterase class II)
MTTGVLDAASCQTWVSLSPGRLLPGRTCLCDIRHGGKTLLRPGSTITQGVIARLTERKVAAIEVTPEDALSLAMPASDPAFLRLDEASIGRLGELIDRGSLFISHEAHTAQEGVVLLGSSAYNQKNRHKLKESHRESAIGLAQMIKTILGGGTPSCQAITTMTADYLTAMTKDMDAVRSIAEEAGADRDLSRHCVKMAVLAMAMALEMGLDESSVSTIGLCGLIHDWGMVRVPEAIRNAPRKLEAHEMFEIKKHPVHTLDMLEQIEGLPGVIPRVCYQVHEQPNGEGYPRGRKGERIHEFSLILGAASAFAALTSPRPQRPALMPYAAMEFLIQMVKRGELDARPVKALLQMQTLFPIGSYVKLSDGRVAQTVGRNGTNYALPIVRVVSFEDTGEPELINLEDAGLSVALALPTPGQGDTPRTPDTTLSW